MRSKPIFQLSASELRDIEEAIHHAAQPDVRVRAIALRMLHKGYSVEAAADVADVAPSLVRQWRRAWRKEGMCAITTPIPAQLNPESFLNRLTALQKISVDLMTAPTLDDICRQAIERGLGQLGFDRMALFFLADRPDCMIPTYGTDEQGSVRDERLPEPVQWGDTDDMQRALARQQDLIIRFSCDLYDNKGKVVGQGWNVMSALWDGDKITGFLAADNLLNQRPLTEADIQILRLYGVTLGCLTSTKRTAEALLKERNMLRGVMDSTVDLIYAKDVNSRVLMTNNIGVHHIGPKSREHSLIGLTDFDYLPQHLAERFYAEEQQLIRTGVPILNREEPGEDDKGNPITYLTTKVPLRDAQGEIIGLVGVSRDITELKQSEEQNLRLILEHERVELMGLLVSNLSHDLKTPLSVIKTNLYLIEQISDPSRQRQKLQSIKDQTERLEKLIQDVLTVSRLDQLEQPIRNPVDMRALMSSVEANLRPRAEAKQQTLDLDLALELPTVSGNAEDLWRMFTNLVENAINYTPSTGKISIEVWAQASGVVTSVRDSGIGITPEQISRIFERFYRADAARNMQQGGTGLGLSIVKMITEQHGGHIKVESTPGSGTHFQVWLPALLT
ncbi:MAG: PAS domain-containing sensor histidine kinase [Chloroflexi bacterium]|nr:PAS domain-containing sensor histidine kinase [Chloroflexota bacterium]MCC6893421.1 PAS domain-containing protein [Anaerolineae bacterium]